MLAEQLSLKRAIDRPIGRRKCLLKKMKRQLSTIEIVEGKVSHNKVAVLYLISLPIFPFHYFNERMSAGKWHCKDVLTF